MKVVLLPLQEGEYNIEKGIRTQEEITSYIRITDSLNKVEYCPLKKPFKVYVDSVRYHESSMMPYIEGKMEGTLYNRYDVNDSIVVKMLYSYPLIVDDTTAALRYFGYFNFYLLNI